MENYSVQNKAVSTSDFSQGKKDDDNGHYNNNIAGTDQGKWTKPHNEECNNFIQPTTLKEVNNIMVQSDITKITNTPKF